MPYGRVVINLNLWRGTGEITDNSWISVTYSYIWEVFTMEKLRKILKETIPLVQVWRWFLGYVDDWLRLLCDFFFFGRKDWSWASILTVDLVVTLQSNKVPVVQPSHAVHPLTPLITYSDEHFSPGSHPSHIPSDVNSKQGESPCLSQPFLLNEEPSLISLSDPPDAGAPYHWVDQNTFLQDKSNSFDSNSLETHKNLLHVLFIIKKQKKSIAGPQVTALKIFHSLCKPIDCANILKIQYSTIFIYCSMYNMLMLVILK